jgi:hypothetical protein
MDRLFAKWDEENKIRDRKLFTIDDEYSKGVIDGISFEYSTKDKKRFYSDECKMAECSCINNRCVIKLDNSKISKIKVKNTPSP